MSAGRTSVRTDQLVARTVLTVYNKATGGALFAALDGFELGAFTLGSDIAPADRPLLHDVFCHSLILSTLLIDIAGS